MITLTSEPDTNGSYCPGRVTFTCNGTNVAIGLDWIINGITSFTFNLIRGDTNFPRTVSERNNITIRVLSVSLGENTLSINIVSVLTVESLDPILEDTVSCKTFSGPSSRFVVNVRGNNNHQ